MSIIDINLDYLGFGIYGVKLLSFTIWKLIDKINMVISNG